MRFVACRQSDRAKICPASKRLRDAFILDVYQTTRMSLEKLAHLGGFSDRYGVIHLLRKTKSEHRQNPRRKAIEALHPTTGEALWFFDSIAKAKAAGFTLAGVYRALADPTRQYNSMLWRYTHEEHPN